MQQLVNDLAFALRVVDQSGIPFKNFGPGVGPYGEPQLLKRIVSILQDKNPSRYGAARTKREPDILIPSQWALEFKIVRPFGDNGCEAEHWSQNLLHPYDGNVSAIGDAMKLLRYKGEERKGVVVFAYEHSPPRIDVGVLVDAFELVSRNVLHIPMSSRHTAEVSGLVHPVHQHARVFGWEIGVG